MLDQSVWVARIFSVTTTIAMVYLFVTGDYLKLTQVANLPTLTQINEESTNPTSYNVLDPKQYECLRENIFFEARNQPLAGQVLVGLTVINRVRDNRFQDTICDVVFAHKQYSWANSGRKKPKLNNKKEIYAWEMSGKIAEYIMRYDVDIGNVTHYHTTSIKKPKWAKSKQFVSTQIIGDHIFYTLRGS